MNQRSVFIPIFQQGWHTRSVLEGVSELIKPDAIHVASLPTEIAILREEAKNWSTAPLVFHNEETFFGTGKLSKAALCARIASLPKLYQPGWFYQQMLKLGCQEAIPELADWTLIWDSDLIPFAGWPSEINGVPAFALLQHKSKGNPKIVNVWKDWIRDFAGVEPLQDNTGTFIPHHMWFPREALAELRQTIVGRLGSVGPWQHALIDSLNTHETFSEFWIVASWLAEKYPSGFAYHTYEVAGETTERFFDDGRGKLTTAFKAWYSKNQDCDFPKYPSYHDLSAFVGKTYSASGDAIPSSLSLEASTRHIMKDEANRHLEETRSRWLVRPADAATLGVEVD
ncbi:MAG: hypothetical protein AAGC73_10585 [Verrucomicrobiota bacterium]